MPTPLADGKGVPDPRPPADTPRGTHDVARLVRDRLLHCVYQPLVDLDSGAVVGHEALLRGPAGTPLATPMALLAAAADAGILVELERHSLGFALADAASAARSAPQTLFVNLEPRTLARHLDQVLETLATHDPAVQVVVEITERALAADPAGVLAGAEELRAAGFAIALDDVGTEPESLAFIPVLRPEVVKLDLRLLRTVEDPATVLVAGAVSAYAEASGADVVAEGIETEEDLTRARVLGATLGQGWWWGRGERELRPTRHAPERFAARGGHGATWLTPHASVAPHRPFRTASKSLLLPMSYAIETAAMQSGVPPVLLACFEHARFFGPRTTRRYAELAARLPFVGALGVGLAHEPAHGVRGVDLAPHDPLAAEWTVILLGAHEAVALVAREAGGTDPRGQELFEFALTHDRELVTGAARALLARFTRAGVPVASGGPPPT